MARFEDIVKRESERSELAHWRQIYLYIEGKFCHAYDQSAWLYSRFAPVALNAIRHKSKQFPEGSYVMVGHPQTSLEKYQPQDSQRTEAEGMVTITLPETAFPAEVTFDVLLSDFARWKQELPCVEKTSDSKKERDGEQRQSQPQANAEKKSVPQTLQDVAKQILAYPIDSRTPIETIQFVSDLKRQISFLVREM